MWQNQRSGQTRESELAGATPTLASHEALAALRARQPDLGIASDDEVTNSAASRGIRAQRAPSRRGGGGLGRSGGESVMSDDSLLSEAELEAVERDHTDGLTSVQIVDIFARRGIRFSEATFRKYVQQGLLPRSRRIGRKGKHKGSLGLYPAATPRRINLIKRLMGENYTIDEIQAHFLKFRDDVEQLQTSLSSLFGNFDDELDKRPLEERVREDIRKDLARSRKAADELLRLIERMERRISDPGERVARAGAPEGAEDLL